MDATEMIVTGFNLPLSYKTRLDEMAKAQDLNASQLVRRILADYFSQVDESQSPEVDYNQAPRKSKNGK